MSLKALSLRALSGFLDQRLKDALPGPRAHELMRAKSTGNLRPRFQHDKPPRPGSVLILLYEENGFIKFPLIKRQDYKGAHGGQVSLPGGKTEPGEDIVATALREGEEEIGISAKDVEVIGRLSDFHVLPSNYIVTPIVGVAHSLPTFIPDTYEVAKILSAELLPLLDDNAIMETEVLASDRYRMIAPHFVIEDEIVWGATAMMINEFRLIVKEFFDSEQLKKP